MTDANSRRLVDKLWSYCNLLRDDGVSTIEYVERLTGHRSYFDRVEEAVG